MTNTDAYVQSLVNLACASRSLVDAIGDTEDRIIFDDTGAPSDFLDVLDLAVRDQAYLRQKINALMDERR